MKITNEPLSAQTITNTGFYMKKSCDDRIAGSVPVWGECNYSQEKSTSFAQNLAEAGAEKAPSDEPFSFSDVVDMVNPLQHIPIIGTLYRNMTGDEIKPVSNVIGGGVFGGVLGAMAGLVNVIAQDATGKDVAENLLSLTSSDNTSYNS